jgi:hypothetical protein
MPAIGAAISVRCGRPFIVMAVAGVVGWSSVSWAQTSNDTPRLKRALQQFPEADADQDGVLTLAEAQAFATQQATAAGSDAGGLSALAARLNRPVFETQIFKATAEQLDAAMQAETAANKSQPLSFEKGNGIRMVSTGHSWVGPAMRTLPEIAQAAGYDGHQLRFHTSGGGTGSANSIWRKELGQYGGEPAKPILLPAIATGKWDVMTWGMYLGDVTEHYTQWIDVCLAKNPQMTFCLQDGWPTFDQTLQDLPKAEALARLDARQTQIQTLLKVYYDDLNARYPGKVSFIPAGGAVVEMLHRYYDGALPDLDCVSENLGGKCGIYRDGGHLSKASGMEWLDGYVYFATLYGESPERIKGWRPQGVPENMDKAMRQAAWKAVIASPYSGVTDADGDGVDDKPAAH